MQFILVTQKEAELEFKPRCAKFLYRTPDKFLSSHLGTSVMGKLPTHKAAHFVVRQLLIVRKFLMLSQNLFLFKVFHLILVLTFGTNLKARLILFRITAIFFFFLIFNVYYFRSWKNSTYYFFKLILAQKTNIDIYEPNVYFRRLK